MILRRRQIARLLVPQTLGLILAVAACPAARAQSGPPVLRLVRVIEADEVGASAMPGLPFPPPGSTVRLLLDEPAPGVASIFLPFVRGGSRAKFRGRRIEIPDPINFACTERADGSFGLLLLDGVREVLTRLEVEGATRATRPRARRSRTSSWGVADPQGMTVDPATGRIFILDAAGHRVVSLEADPEPPPWRARRREPARVDGRISEIALPRGLAGLRGIAINPIDGHLHVLSPGAQELYELDAAGRFLALRELSALGPIDPKAMTFAPSTDRTDDPSQAHLFLVAAGPSGEAIVTEWSLSAPVSDDPWPETPDPTGDPDAPNTASLIQVVVASDFDPPSPDPAGIAYDAPSDSLLISDSEVNETALYEGYNVFEMTRFGEVVGTIDTTDYSDEPTGVAINPANGQCFFSDDTGTRSVHVVDPGPDGLCLTGDDHVTSFPTGDFGASDPEGLAFGQGSLFVLDGANREIYQIAPGANGVFDGAPPSGDDQVTSCDTASIGINDPEGLSFDPAIGHLYVVGRPETQVAQISTACSLVRMIDISAANAVNPAGAAVAPSSVDPAEMSIWIADRGVDNNRQSDENDGWIYELSLPFLTPGNTPPLISAGADQTLVFPDDALLEGSASDDGFPSPSSLTHTWIELSGQGAVSFDDASQAVTTASFSAPGSYRLRLTASDGELQSSDDVIITVEPSDGSTIFEKRVDASSDDAEEDELGSIDRYSSDLELVFNNDGDQTVGIRINGVSVPPGATILDAYIQFQVDETSSAPASLTLEGEAADHAAVFLQTTGNISSRPRTVASLRWSPVPWLTMGEAGPDQRTPDLSPILQEIVDRPGWSSGNALAVLITGVGERVAESVDGDVNGAPLLHVRYRMGGNKTPAVTITAPPDGTNTRQGDPITLSGAGTDPEDGDLSASLSWVSDLDGPLGSGASLTLSSLSPGLHTITASVTDSGGRGDSDQITLTSLAVLPDGSTVVEKRVDASSDDAEEDELGQVSIGSADLELVVDGGPQTVGIRFHGVHVPPGATILSASIQLQADETGSSATSLTFEGEASDDAALFVQTTGNISSRPRTTASVPWSPVPWLTVGEAGPDQQTPDLSPILQEIVDRPGWSSGNALAILVTGSGERVAEAFDGDVNGAPRLHLRYRSDDP
jgi:hypothetical protein